MGMCYQERCKFYDRENKVRREYNFVLDNIVSARPVPVEVEDQKEMPPVLVGEFDKLVRFQTDDDEEDKICAICYGRNIGNFSDNDYPVCVYMNCRHAICRECASNDANKKCPYCNLDSADTKLDYDYKDGKWKSTLVRHVTQKCSIKDLCDHKWIKNVLISSDPATKLGNSWCSGPLALKSDDTWFSANKRFLKFVGFANNRQVPVFKRKDSSGYCVVVNVDKENEHICLVDGKWKDKEFISTERKIFNYSQTNKEGKQWVEQTLLPFVEKFPKPLKFEEALLKSVGGAEKKQARRLLDLPRMQKVIEYIEYRERNPS